MSCNLGMSHQEDRLEGKKKRSNVAAAFMAIGTALGGFVLLIVLVSMLLAPRLKSVSTGILQTEAKMALAGLYTAEKAFHAEYEQYTTDIESIGFKPYEPTQYKFGFAAPSTIVKPFLAKQVDAIKYDPNRMTSDIFKETYGDRVPASSFTDLVQKHCPDCTASENGFKIVAIGNLDEDETLDVWTIDHDKNLVNISDDVAN